MPISQVLLPARRTIDIGWASEIVGRFSVPFCSRVAASAKKSAAISAKVAAMPRNIRSDLNGPQGTTATPGGAPRLAA